MTSYNLLSDALCSADYYTLAGPAACDPDARLERVKAKLATEMEAGAVLCLQEVSRKWGAKLVPFFEEYGYAYAAAMYGHDFNGYMGQCLAWPRRVFSVEEVDTSRISDTVPGWRRSGKPHAPKERSAQEQARQSSPPCFAHFNTVQTCGEFLSLWHSRPHVLCHSCPHVNHLV